MHSTHLDFVSPNRSRSGSFGSSEETAENRKLSRTLYIYNFFKTIVTSKYYTGFMTALTIFVLFADDIRLAYFSLSSDEVFFALFFVSFLVFLFEVMLYCAIEKEYFLPYPSFYFWLDILAAFSIWLDVPWLWNPIDALEAQNMKSDALIAGKASRVGTRAAKIVRIIRLLRMVRVAKFLSYEQRSSLLHRAVMSDTGTENERTRALTTNGGNKGLSEEDSSIVRSPSSTERKLYEGTGHPADSEPSIVSQKMTKLTNSRVILITLVCILLFPFFDLQFNSSQKYQGEIYGLLELHRLPQDRNASGSINSHLFKARVEQYIRDVGDRDSVHAQSYYGKAARARPRMARRLLQ